MVVDVLTKEAKPNDDLKDITIGNRFRNAFAEDNIVKCVKGEIKLMNPRNKSIQFMTKSANKVMPEANDSTSNKVKYCVLPSTEGKLRDFISNF